jgi:hypothetical protein
MGLDAHVLFRGVDPDNHNTLTDCLVSKDLGNITVVASLREQISGLPGAESAFPIILKRVIYNGSHTGDEIPIRDVPKLKSELLSLAKFNLDDAYVKTFVRDMNELCAASLFTGNAIVF